MTTGIPRHILQDNLFAIVRLRNRKWLVISILIFFISFLTAQLLFLQYSGPFVKMVLPYIVEKKTAGLYEVRFDSLKFDTETRSLKISNLKIIPNRKIYNILVRKNAIKAALYEVHIPMIELKGLNIFMILLRKKLQIRKIVFVEPSANLIGLPKKVKKKKIVKYDAVNLDLFPTLLKFFSAVKIKEIQLQNGYFDFFVHNKLKKKATIVSSISISLYEFDLTKENIKENRTHIFFAKDIEINIKDYSNVLNDGIHIVRAKELNISTRKEEIFAKDIQLIPEKIDLVQAKLLNINLYEIIVPELKITHIDFPKAYFEGKVNVSHLALPDITVKLISKQKTSVDTTKLFNISKIQDGLNLYDLIKGHLKSIQLAEFDLSNASFKWFKGKEQFRPAYKANKINITLTNFLVDSVSEENKDKIIYADDIDLEMTEFQMIMIDKIHVLKASSLSVSTKKSNILANEVEFTPELIQSDPLSYSGRIIYDIYVPQLSINGADLKMAFNYEELPVNLLTVTKPMVKIASYNVVRKITKSSRKRQNIYDIISEYVKIIKIANVRLQKGVYSWVSYRDSQIVAFSNGRINLELRNFLFNPIQKLKVKKLFYAEEVEAKFQDYTIKLPENIHILEAREFDISTSNSKIILDGFSIRPFENHQSMENIQKSPKSSLIDLSIEKITINGIDIHKAYIDRNLKINTIKIDEPGLFIRQFSDSKPIVPDPLNVDISLNADNEQNVQKDFKKQIKLSFTDSLARKEMYDKLSVYLKIVDIDSVSIDNGSFGYISADKNRHIQFSISNQLGMKLHDFKFNIDSLQNSQKNLFSEDIQFKLQNLNISMPKKNYSLEVASIVYSTSKSEFKATDLNLMTSGRSKKPLKINIVIPELIMSGIDLLKFYETQRIDISALKLTKPLIVFQKNKLIINNDSSKNKSFTKLLKLPGIIKSLNLNQFSITEGKVKYFTEDMDGIGLTAEAEMDAGINNFSFDRVGEEPLELSDLTFNDISFGLKNIIAKSADSLHLIQIKNLDFSSRKSNLLIKGIHLSYNENLEDFQIIDYLKKANKSALFKTEIPRISLDGLDFTKAFARQDFTIDSVFVSQPEISLIKLAYLIKNDSVKTEQKNFYNKLKPIIKSLKINKLCFDQGSLNVEKQMMDDNFSYAFDDLSGVVKDFQIDSTQGINKTSLFNADDISLKMKRYYLEIPNSFYSLSTGEVGISSSKSEIYIDSIHFYPRGDKYKLASKLDFQKGIHEITGKRLTLSGVDFPAFIKEKKYKIQKIEFDKFYINSFKNRQLPYNFTLRPPMPQELLMRFKSIISIDTIDVKNSRFNYEEMSRLSTNPGLLNIDNFYVRVTNLTNDSLLYSNKKFFTQVNTSGYIMGTGYLQAFLKFAPSDSKKVFEWGGNLDSMDIRTFNPFVENVASVSIKSGTIKSLRFNAKSDYDVTRGEMILYYNNLKINILERDTLKGNRGFTSFFANRILRNNNPKKRFYPLRIGKMYYERDISKQFFHYLSNSLLTGVKSTMGFNSSEIKEEMRKAKEEQKLKEKEIRQQAKEQKKVEKSIQKRETKKDRDQRRKQEYINGNG